MIVLEQGGVALTQRSLSNDLRTRTALLHDQAEALLRLPDSITNKVEYIDWLVRFLGFYAPLERAFDTLKGWEMLEPMAAECRHSQRLIHDLGELGVEIPVLTHLPNAQIPKLRTFAHALGARYVLEGATLGGKVILRDLQARMGPQLFGATDFFSGGGSAAASNWRGFKLALDHYGEQHPEGCQYVLTGAAQTFRALLVWFRPFAVRKTTAGQAVCDGSGLNVVTAHPPAHPDRSGEV